MIVLSDLSKPTDSATAYGQPIALTAKVDTALCVGAGGSSGSLADKPILRNAKGQLVIPASQLKGRLRHGCERLARALEWPVCQSPRAEAMCPQWADNAHNSKASLFRRSDYLVPGYSRQNPDNPQQNPQDLKYHCLICRIFGNPVLPSRLMVEDLVCDLPQALLPETLRPGVTLNRRRGTAEDQKLYFLETSPPGAGLEFKGQLLLSPEAPDEALPLLLAALHQIHALGGSKSAGLGWVKWTVDNLDQLRPQLTDEQWQKLKEGCKNA